MTREEKINYIYEKDAMAASPEFASDATEYVLMCKDTPVYSISSDTVLDADLLPGALRRGTLSYDGWMQTRYSTGSNVTARRLMMRSHGTDNHRKVVKSTRALSLSDCYWLKANDEVIMFSEVTPYFNEEWNGSGEFKGGSISTLFVNGAADKYWANATTLVKKFSYREIEPYLLCKELGLAAYASTAVLNGRDLYVTNFTNINVALESMEQSGMVGQDDDARSTSVDIFGWRAVALFVLDYLVEHDDRHWGNFGFLRDTNTGKYIGMSPYFDFDWAWSGESIRLPEGVLREYYSQIESMCEEAKRVAPKFEHGDVIIQRANELLVG